VALTSLTTLAQRVGAANGAARVGAGRVVLTTRQDANTIASGAVVSSDQPAYLIELEGTFTLTTAHAPKGQAVPQGRYLTMVVDAATGLILDTGITGHAVDLSALGPVADMAI
jgi:hypothetical protein